MIAMNMCVEYCSDRLFRDLCNLLEYCGTNLYAAPRINNDDAVTGDDEAGVVHEAAVFWIGRLNGSMHHVDTFRELFQWQGVNDRRYHHIVSRRYGRDARFMFSLLCDEEVRYRHLQ